MVFLQIGRKKAGTLFLPGDSHVRSVALNLIGRLLNGLFSNAERSAGAPISGPRTLLFRRVERPPSTRAVRTSRREIETEGDVTRAAKSYGDNTEWLLEVKRRYDPDNIFSSAIPLPVEAAASGSSSCRENELFAKLSPNRASGLREHHGLEEVK
jgi:hypothetical protein